MLFWKGGVGGWGSNQGVLNTLLNLTGKQASKLTGFRGNQTRH